MSISSRLSDLHQEFVRRQWLAIKNQETGLEGGYQDRIAEYRRFGTVTLQTVVASAGITAEDFARCTLTIQNDPRLKFLQRLASVAAMGGQFGQALEESFYGASSSTSVVREATALVGMFTRMLDDFIDEAPEIIAPERDPLLAILSKKSWLEPEPAAFLSDEDLSGKHPGISLLYKITRACVTKIKQSEYWLGESSLSVREDFSTAAEAALLTEYDTIDCRMPPSSQNYDPAMRLILKAKSQNIVWVLALTPTTFLGWPEQLNRFAYEVSIKRLGDLFGWLDDAQDLVEDIATGATNEVLLDLYENAGSPAYSTHDELHEMIADWLSDDRTVTQLVSKGQTLYKESLYGFETLGAANPAPMQQYITDVTLAWIEPASPAENVEA